MIFEKESSALVARRGGETLRIEAWGKDALRVRAYMADGKSSCDWALTEKPEACACEVRIGEEGAGGRLLQEDQVTSLQSYIDNYLSFLTTGMDTGEYQTNLQNSLETLQVQISALE